MDSVDLLVIGAGMAGATAAARAVQQGASVVVVEKAPAIGGSAVYAGFVWTASSEEVMRRENPEADPALTARLVEGFEPALEWVRSLGVEIGEGVSVLGFGRGYPVDVAGLMMRCERIVREAEGSALLTKSTVKRLLVEDGAVVGAEVVDGAGERRVIWAVHTLLASGGFGGDPDLRAQLIHPQARDMALRANRQSTGDGLRLGLAAGAAFGAGTPASTATWWSRTCRSPTPPSSSTAPSTTASTGYCSTSRASDSAMRRSETTSRRSRCIEQPEARALLVYDQRVHEDWELQPYVEGVEAVDKFQLAYRIGARCAIADSLEEFEELPEEWGYPGPRVLESFGTSTGNASSASRRPRGSGCDTAAHAALLRDRGRSGDHVLVRRAADRRRSAGSRRAGRAGPRSTRGRCRQRRRVLSGLRRRTGQRARVRAPAVDTAVASLAPAPAR